MSENFEDILRTHYSTLSCLFKKYFTKEVYCELLCFNMKMIYCLVLWAFEREVVTPCFRTFSRDKLFCLKHPVLFAFGSPANLNAGLGKKKRISCCWTCVPFEQLRTQQQLQSILKSVKLIKLNGITQQRYWKKGHYSRSAFSFFFFCCAIQKRANTFSRLMDQI